MINAQDQQRLFIDIALQLQKKIEIYVIGGTAMIFRGLKAQTLDVDVVFNNEEDRQAFKEAALAIGYKPLDARIVYPKKENVPDVVTMGDVRIDLFLFKIISSTFTPSMQQRAVEKHEFGTTLTVKVADPHDILLMKVVTGREKDDEDIVSLITNTTINWNSILKELQEQLALGNERATLDTGTTLERLANEKRMNIPKEVLDALWALLQKQVKQKALKKKR